MLWFGNKNKEIGIFAKNIAQEFFSHFPPSMFEDMEGADKKAAQKAKKQYERVMGDVVQHMIKFKSDHKLKVYGKAKLHLEFTNYLAELGYKQEYCAKVNEEIMVKSP
ncbi:MAG: hypothetical protein ACWA5Q_04925 [bacterium]